jgi:hypothetical protein
MIAEVHHQWDHALTLSHGHGQSPSKMKSACRAKCWPLFMECPGYYSCSSCLWHEFIVLLSIYLIQSVRPMVSSSSSSNQSSSHVSSSSFSRRHMPCTRSASSRRDSNPGSSEAPMILMREGLFGDAEKARSRAYGLSESTIISRPNVRVIFHAYGQGVPS